MGIIKRLLGIEDLEKRVEQLEGFRSRIEKVIDEEKRILTMLKAPMTTNEIAKKLNKSRTWASLTLNKLEREGKVREVGYKKRKLLYAAVG